MQRENADYDVYGAARVLGLSPARVRQMLRSGELEGEREEERAGGVLGPWRVRARSVEKLRDAHDGEGSAGGEMGGSAAETVAMPPQEDPTSKAGSPEHTPSEASELLSQSVQGIMEKVESLKRELEGLEGRLEFAEIQEFASREGLRAEKERADRLQAELDAERAKRADPGDDGPKPRRRLFGG